MGHDWDGGSVTTPATCEEDGVRTFACNHCSETRTETIPATGHTWDEGVVKQEAGCTEDGVMRYTCVSCHATREENITATGHQYTKTVVDPTCTSSGYEQYLCFACGYEYHDHFTAPLGHDYEAVLTEPTCTEQGYTTHTCSRCEDHYVDGYVEALGHAWGEWTKEIAEDCFHPGVEVRTCAHCQAKESQTVEANGAHCPSKDFQDVDASRWYHEGVDFVLKHGIMKGMGGGLFQPNGTLTRGQLVTTLYRMAGEPETEGDSPFTDVDMERFYGKAVVWAAKNGIAKGVNTTVFAPHAPVTREQMVTFLYRYANLAGEDVTGDYDLTEFGDHGAIHNYAKEPLAWAVDKGLVTGMDGLLNPRGNATRAQIATIFLRYSENV